ncbi:dephospho-CoA kinase [Winogradskyella sp. A3E31]|uniref:dephospho-CoA kinase n=1 Tax=Winogradskyella sp. A3E31 TaxID=3349637 RepID=UPI00398B3E2E
MKIIGLTGGIGSGKTTMAVTFEDLGVPVYNADREAKDLMGRSKIIKRKLTALFGDSAYTNEKLNRDYIRKRIFNDDTLRMQMNAIVHPKVKSHFNRWLKKQNSAYVIKEAAIIFEIGQQDSYDKIIVVVADKEARIKRVLKRDDTDRQSVLKIIDKQLPDEEKTKRADFVIVNNDLQKAKNQVVEIHRELLKFSKVR